MYLIARSMHSSRGTLVNKLSTSKEIINFPEVGNWLISFTNERVAVVVVTRDMRLQKIAKELQ